MEKETSHGIKDLNKKELEERKKFQELETVSEVWVVAFNILEEKQFWGVTRLKALRLEERKGGSFRR